MPRPSVAPTEVAAELAWRSEPSGDAYEGMVHEAVKAIRRGELEKVVLARSKVAESPRRFSVAATARAMAAAFPGATTYLVQLPNGEALCGATPELIASVRGGVFRTQAVAGTGSPETLASSAKDRHEHQVVIDDITRELRTAGVDAEAARETRVVATGDLAHLVTPIEAQLPPGMGVLDIVARLHPTAALSGTPRAAARSWIRQREHLDRGFYGGPVGWADASGNGVFVVALRCAWFSADRRTVRCFGGAGIVAQSDAAQEREETAAKMRAAMRCLRVEAQT